MSYGGYQQYGGNPYGQAEAGYGGSNPYGGTAGGYGDSNPYGGTHAQNEPQLDPPNPLHHGDSNYSQGSQYSAPSAPPTHQGSAPLNHQDFLSRTNGAKTRIGQLTTNIGEISTIHQRMLHSTDNRSSAQLESIVSQTQILNTQIKDEIKFLERDAARDPNSSIKRSQVETLKRTFKDQLQKFQQEESDYSQRYREAIARQYRIINPEASEEEVREAANADWGNEGIFQQALKSNRSGQASSALGAVRARHNDIQRIEKTLGELAMLFQELAQQVEVQEHQVEQVEQQTVQVTDDTKQANEKLDQGIASARRARKLKWWTLLVVVAIIVILALVLGLYFGLRNNGGGGGNNNNNAAA